MKNLFVIFAICMLLVVSSCSDDNTAVNTVQEEIERPPIPEPTYYAGPVPLKSVELIIEAVPLSDFSPIVTGASSPTPPTDYGYVVDSVYGTHGVASTEFGIYKHRIKLCIDSKVVDTPNVGFYIGGNGNPWVWTNCYPLSNQPYLQLVRYWVRVGAVERYSGSTSKTTTRSTTRGTTETSASEFTKTLGIETSVSGSWFVDFEVKVKTEFSWSESHETSISEEETYEESFTISSPENQNIVYCVWQLVEEYRVVGTDGELFTDPNYLFDDESNSIICPTNETVPMTTYFDN